MTNPTLKIGKQTWKFFGLYLGIFYLFPTFFHMLHPEDYRWKFTVPDEKWPLLYFFFTLGLVFIFNTLIPNIKLKGGTPVGNLMMNSRLNLFLVANFLLLSIWFCLNYDINYRHSGESLTESGGLMIVLFAIRTYFKVYLLMHVFRRLNSFKANNVQRLILFLCGLSFVLSLNSSIDAVYVLVALLFVIKKERLLFESPKVLKTILQRVSRIFGKPVVLLCTIVMVIFIGSWNKIGFERAYHKFIDTTRASDIIVNTGMRISTWYASAMSLGYDYDLEDNPLAVEALSGTFEEAVYRGKKLLGVSGAVKPEYQSVSRLNYLNLFHHAPNPRTGTSPGIMASPFYLPLFPINFCIIAIYVVLVLRCFSRVFDRGGSPLTTASSFIILLFVLPVVETPISIINVFDTVFLFFFFFCASVRVVAKEIDKREARANVMMIKQAQESQQAQAQSVGVKVSYAR